METKRIKSAKDLKVYKKAYALAMEIFEYSKSWPDAENSETDTWLDFAKDCKYLSEEKHCALVQDCNEIGDMLGSMIKKPGVFNIDH